MSLFFWGGTYGNGQSSLLGLHWEITPGSSWKTWLTTCKANTYLPAVLLLWPQHVLFLSSLLMKYSHYLKFGPIWLSQLDRNFHSSVLYLNSRVWRIDRNYSGSLFMLEIHHLSQKNPRTHLFLPCPSGGRTGEYKNGYGFNRADLTCQKRLEPEEIWVAEIIFIFRKKELRCLPAEETGKSL